MAARAAANESLLAAAKDKDLRGVKAALAAGADVNYCDQKNSSTAAMYAADRGADVALLREAVQVERPAVRERSHQVREHAHRLDGLAALGRDGDPLTRLARLEAPPRCHPHWHELL